MKYLIICLYVLWIINIGTYIYHRAKINGKAKLKLKRPVEDGGIMTYCLPGMKSTPEMAFRFQERASIHEKNFIVGGITYVAYENSGFDARTIANQIIKDIREHDYQPVIISVSVGDQIARYVEQEIDNLSIIAINPATNVDCLKDEVVFKLTIAEFFKNIFLALVGWIGLLPVIRTDGRSHQSPSLANDMKNCLAKSNLQVTTNATKVIVLSVYDEILDNSSVRSEFGHINGLKIALVDTEHANLSIGGILYRDRIGKLIKNIYNTP